MEDIELLKRLKRGFCSPTTIIAADRIEELLIENKKLAIDKFYLILAEEEARP
jgi:hypothetical protein